MNKNKFKELFKIIVVNTKVKIKELALTELDNTEKKQKLDDYIVHLINITMDNLGFNFVARWVVNHYLIPYVDDLTQYVYDLLKAKVNGVTKENGQ